MRSTWYRSAGAAIVTAITISLSSAPVTTASAAEIKVLSTTNMFPTLDALRSAFESASGRSLKIDHGGAAPVKNRAEGGEVADVVIHSRWALDDLAKGDNIKPGSTLDIAHIRRQRRR